MTRISATVLDGVYSATELVMTPAVTAQAGVAEDFFATVGSADGNFAFIIENPGTAAVNAVFLPGSFWYSGAGGDVSAEIPSGKTCLLKAESGRNKRADGTVCIRITPAEGQTLSGVRVGYIAI